MINLLTHICIQRNIIAEDALSCFIMSMMNRPISGLSAVEGNKCFPVVLRIPAGNI